MYGLSVHSRIEKCGAVDTFCWSLAGLVSYFSDKIGGFSFKQALLSQLIRFLCQSSSSVMLSFITVVGED